MRSKFINFINYLKNNVSVRINKYICLIILLLLFYILQLITLDRIYIFCFVLFLILLYSWFIQHYNIIINQFINIKIKAESKESIYQWLCFYLKLNLYKNVILYILLQFDNLYCKFLKFINKKFNDNIWIDRFFNIVVRHLILIPVLYIILYYYYGMLYDLKKNNGIYKYLIFFSILIFTNIIYLFKLFIMLYSFKTIYCFILCIGLFYDFINYVISYFYYKWFKKVYENPVYSILLIYKYRTLGTFTGLVTLSLYNNYKLIIDKDSFIDFNKLYSNYIKVILYDN